MDGTISYAGNFGQTMSATMMVSSGNAGAPAEAQQKPISEEEMIEFIVSQINALLKRNYSIVDFDEIEGIPLLQVLSDVFGTLTRDAEVNFQDVPAEAGVAKLLEFLLKTLNYKVPPSIQHLFHGGFQNGDKTIMYPVLYWVLKHMPQNTKRVYLARYLTRVEIPEDQRMADDGLRDLYQHYESLRADFIQTHKRVDALREAHADPAEARRKINSLEGERDRLKQYIENQQKKLTQAADKDALLAACKQLRQELEDQQKRNEKFAEQQQALYSAQKRQAEIQQRLQNVRRDTQDARVSAICSRLNDEIATNRMKLEEQLPRELNEKRAENAALQKLLTEPLDISSLHAEMQGLDREIQELQVKVAERQRPGDDGNSIQTIKTHVQRLLKKKNEILSELSTLHNENNRYLEELRAHEQNVEQFRNSKMLKGEDFRKYSNQVRSKTAATKTMKARMNDLRSEWGVLQYTEKVLREKHDLLQGDIEAMERQMGISGYVQTSENLHRIAQQRNDVEQVKGKTLEELSRVVQEFAVAIRERRGKLAPQIMELRNQRQAATEVETEWSDKKSQFEHQEGLLMQDVNKLETEVAQLTDETKLNEALYHRLKAQSLLLESQLKRVEEEKRARAGQVKIGEFNSHEQMIRQKIEMLDQRNKELLRKRREIEENHDSSLQQVEWFGALKKILEVKIRSLQTAPTQGPDTLGRGQNLDKDIAAIMGQTNTRAGVDMLVLGNN